MMKTAGLTTYYGNLPALRHSTSWVNKGRINALIPAENGPDISADEFPDSMTQHLRELPECHV
jgi:hypothetical protein